jgi:carbamoyl-phosphate synthase large subunit
MAKSLNILLTSVGRRVSLLEAFRKALADLKIEGRVLAADRSPLAPAFHAADEGCLVPPVGGPEYVDALLTICRTHDVGLVFPLIDWELAVIAEAHERFAAVGARAVISDKAVIDICRDKQRTCEFLKRHRLGTPEIFTYEEALRRPFPLFVKPRYGSSAKDVHCLPDEEALRFHYGRNVESVIQEYVRGTEFTVDVYAGFDGVPRVAVPRQRIEVRAGEVAKARTVRHPAIIRQSLRLVRALGACVGVVTLQCFLTREDQIKFIEVNPRFGGGVPLSIYAGADFPRWIIEEHLGRKPRIDPDAWKADLVMLRYDAAVFRRWNDVAADEGAGAGARPGAKSGG